MNSVPTLARFDAWTRATSLAAEGARVLYLTSEAYARSELLPAVAPSDQRLLERISFKFLPSLDELKRFLCYAHVLFAQNPSSIPGAIFVDYEGSDGRCAGLLENLIEALEPVPFAFITH